MILYIFLVDFFFLNEKGKERRKQKKGEDKKNGKGERKIENGDKTETRKVETLKEHQ